jgi:hypothetical protein
MQAGLSPALHVRTQHRHELRTLTYVTLIANGSEPEANGGIVRNLTDRGIAVQTIAAVRPGQQFQVRFDLRGQRLRVETRGQVMWANSAGQCGILFLDVTPRVTRQINEWILGNLLAGLPPRPDLRDPGAARSLTLVRAENDAKDDSEHEYEDDGLMVSAAPVKVIPLPLRPQTQEPAEVSHAHASHDAGDLSVELDWLSQPLSGRGLAWTVNTLVVLAALFLFALVFLSVTREMPQRPLAMAAGIAVLVAGLYWGFFKVFGGGSPGARLARLRESDAGDEDIAARFR